ncbi:MAG: SAM-dependent methyltransferase [Myxococcales bacterium]|nr:SAM-dependent methyltransferase [Myxococcales bacterium]
MRPGNRSRTSDWVAALRALYSEAAPELAIFDDAVALRLLPRGLGRIVRSAAKLPFGVRVAHRVIGAATRGLSYGVPLRTAAIDDAVRAAVDAGIDQLVLLGAGLDARAWRMPQLREVTVYELDHPDTQGFKREGTRGLAPLAKEARFCPIDFERESIPDALAAHGFERERPSMWVWEGVTMYLTLDAIEATLDRVSDLSAPGSRLAMTYLPRNYASPRLQTVGELGAMLIGEALKSQLDPPELGAQLEQRGFRVERDDSALEWAARWPKRDAQRVRAFERLAVAVRVSAG